ncbi:MAG: NTP transferase domain-containing protein [Alphaproteobacteria bacterium]|nr:NTP transferase domain-containing protein [Alphaproteobacteria bacterium]
MKFGPVPLAAALGATLAHGQLLGGRRLAKGHRLTAADLAAARAEGLAELVVAQLAADDVAEDAAALALARALAGPGTRLLAPVHGRVNLAAAADGLLQLPAGMVAAVNNVDDAITLASLPAGRRVAAGEIIATIKIIPYGVPAATLATALARAQSLAVAPFRPLAASLIATTLPGTSAKALDKLARITTARLAGLGSALVVVPPCPHDTAALAGRLAGLAGDVLLVAGASATVDRADVIPAAILAAGGQVERVGMPVDPGNLLVLGRLGGRPVIGLPGCARSPKRNGLDIVLEHLAAGLPVDSAMIAGLGEGGLLPEAERPEPRTAAAAPGRVGALLLAAGRSSRFGGEHKLLALWRGQPLVAHVADAIAAAGLPPPLVVLGHDGERVRAALAGRAARFVVAADWADGMGRSLAAGIAAVPADWDAALVCLADMPAVEAGLIAALAAAAGDVVMPTWDGRRGHPVRWPRAAFGRLRQLSGDQGGRALLADFAVTEVAAPSPACLIDVDTPAALATLGD